MTRIVPVIKLNQQGKKGKRKAMTTRHSSKMWKRMGYSRREFWRIFGIASSALTFSPFFLGRLATVFALPTVKVYLVKNGDSFQNTAKIWEMTNGTSYINANDIVVIKGSGQWPSQGYTHTGCIKGITDQILAIPGFSGEVLICDNVQEYGEDGSTGFDTNNRTNNWPDHNWNSLAAEYQGLGDPVAAKKWQNSLGAAITTITGTTEGWRREFFSFHGQNAYLSSPVFQSPFDNDKMIDMGQLEAWKSGGYTGQKVVPIFMPTLNYHSGYAGVTSAIKCFFGATEIHGGVNGTFTFSSTNYNNIHSATFTPGDAVWAGELTARFMNNMYSPALFVTAAMFTGTWSRTGAAVETKTVLACENPVTLDYVACKEVISPYNSTLDPDQPSKTRDQIDGCLSGGIGTITVGEYEVVTYDFDNPTVNRTDIDRKIKEYKEGTATEGDVKTLLQQYFEGS